MKVHAPLQLRATAAGPGEARGSAPRLVHLSSPWAITTVQPNAGVTVIWFVVGSDLAAQIPRWKQARAFLETCHLAIAPRQGWPLSPQAIHALNNLGGRWEILDLNVPASASSELRAEPEPTQIPAGVWPLLLEHHLYGLKPHPC